MGLRETKYLGGASHDFGGVPIFLKKHREICLCTKTLDLQKLLGCVQTQTSSNLHIFKLRSHNIFLGGCECAQSMQSPILSLHVHKEQKLSYPEIMDCLWPKQTPILKLSMWEAFGQPPGLGLSCMCPQNLDFPTFLRRVHRHLAAPKFLGCTCGV